MALRPPPFQIGFVRRDDMRKSFAQVRFSPLRSTSISICDSTIDGSGLPPPSSCVLSRPLVHSRMRKRDLTLGVMMLAAAFAGPVAAQSPSGAAASAAAAQAAPVPAAPDMAFDGPPAPVPPAVITGRPQTARRRHVLSA